MSKKAFGSGIDAIFNKNKTDKSVAETHKQKNQDIRTTVVLDSDLLEIVKAISYWERKSLRQIITESLNKKISSIDPKSLKTAIDNYKNSMDS